MAAAVEIQLKQIAEMVDIEELRALLVEALSISLEKIFIMAGVIRRLDELGDDLSDLELPWLSELRKVGDGQILPGVIMLLRGKPSLLQKVAALPLRDQKLIASGEPLKVLLPGGDHCMVLPANMNGNEIRQMFAADHIRGDAEQASWLRAQVKVAVPNDQVWEKEKIYADRKNQCLVVGPHNIPTSDLARYLSQLTEKRTTRR